jgi:phospholipase C
MLTEFNRRLRDRAAVTAAILSIFGANAANADEKLGGAHRNDVKTVSPIKHVIVIMGENRTFDHLFATYQPRPGEHVDDLLSKKIINIDGTPGPNYGLAAQNYASVTWPPNISTCNDRFANFNITRDNSRCLKEMKFLSAHRSSNPICPATQSVSATCRDVAAFE